MTPVSPCAWNTRSGRAGVIDVGRSALSTSIEIDAVDWAAPAVTPIAVIRSGRRAASAGTVSENCAGNVEAGSARPSPPVPPAVAATKVELSGDDTDTV